MPGIGPDKISDLAVNVIRGELVSYTEEQCRLFNVPTERINSDLYWDHERAYWASRYADLPVYRDERVVLVPKAAVRVRLIPDYEEFYSRFVLDFLEAEHLHANDSLVTLLKNGTPKVFRGDLKNRYRLSKDFLFEFSLQHPEVLKAYKETLPAKARPLDSAVIEGRQAIPREPTNETAVKLAAIPAGREHANEYHELILGALNQVFYPWLTRPQKEQPVDDGRKRIDILYSNSSEEGFFSRLVNHYKIHCPFISVECKNYSEDPANPELDQLLGRLSRKRGYFGILLCREIRNNELMLKRLQDVVNNNSDRLILVLEDSDVVSLLKLKGEGKRGEISEYLDRKLQPILM